MTNATPGGDHPLSRFWHPVALSRELKKQPLKVEICSTELVLFRQKSGSVAALGNRCPHRMAQLSCGQVKDDRIHCPYHGWNFDSDGIGDSPRAARKRIKASSYKAQEFAGVIWVTSKENQTEFEFSGILGMNLAITSKQTLRTPLPICVDNLLDQEHTNFVHKIFTFTNPDPDFKNKLTVDKHEDKIVVRQEGKRQSFGLKLLKLFGYNWGEYSDDSQEVTFTPPKAVVDLMGKSSPEKDTLPFFIRVIQVYVPKNDTETMGFTFLLSSKRFSFLFSWPLKIINWYELMMDSRVMIGIGEQGVDLKGAQLGKFDAGIVKGRKLLKSLYEEA